MLALNVHATYGTALVHREPLVDTLDVKQVHARHASHALLVLKVTQTNGALLHAVVIVVLAALHHVLVAVRQRVGLYDVLTCASVQVEQVLLKAHNVLETSVEEVETRESLHANVARLKDDGRGHGRRH